MGIFTPKKKNLEVTFIEEKIIIVKGERWHHHEFELQEIKLFLKQILKNQNKEMGKSQERFDLLMGRLDTVTTDIATDYKTLLDAVKEGADSISEESFAKHEANIAILEALGASVDNPVPPTEPPVEG